MSKFYEDLNEVYLTFENILKEYNRSIILQKYFSDMLESFTYANLINLFFTNLNIENVKGLDLPKGNIGKIKEKYKDLRKKSKKTLSISLENGKIDAIFYDEFKARIKKDFPDFSILSEEIEKKIDLKKLRKYLKEKERTIKGLGRKRKDINVGFMTAILETYVQKNQSLPINKKLNKMITAVIKEVLPYASNKIKGTLDELSKNMLASERKFQKEFENRLYVEWNQPFDLLECLIKVSLESGQTHKNKINQMSTVENKFKHSALFQIHARGLQISNEILVLLKAGYPDGANSRWRSLHELAVISFFLLDNADDVSKRYLEHDIVRRFKEATDYRICCKKLGYLPLSRKEFNLIKKEKERL